MVNGVPRILIVEDEQAVRTLLRDFFDLRGFQAAEAAGGQEALAQLAASQFDLVLSDVRMPGMTGIDLLSEINRLYEDVGVVMLTGCEDVSLAVKAMKMGALDYVQKPFRLEDVDAAVRKALEAREQKLRQSLHVLELEKAVEQRSMALRESLNNLHEASQGTLEALVAALDAREHETQAHSKRVSEYTVHLARQMGVVNDQLEAIRCGAMLHDIGKIGISDTILLKPDRLTENEWAEMRRHPEIGHWILNGVESLRPASEIALSHHERFDGDGYPRRLKGKDIPLGARIFAVVDSLDAITSDRPYHRGSTYEEAREEIVRHSGTQFDPAVVEHFLRVPATIWDEIRQRTVESVRVPVEHAALEVLM
jgi:putative two-component system response regulator